MARGRQGGDGAPFNLGEMTVTRCTRARSRTARSGHAYVAGRDARPGGTGRGAGRGAAGPGAAARALLAAVVAPLAAAQAARAREDAAQGRGNAGAVLHHGDDAMTTMLDSPASPIRCWMPRRCFRAVLDAMARPGRVQRAAPACRSRRRRWARAAAAVLLTLADADTPVWLDAGAGGRGLAALPCRRADRGEPRRRPPSCWPAARRPRCAGLAPGTEEEPHRSATLILQVAALEEGAGWRLTGPGIEHAHRLRVDGPAGRLRRGMGGATARASPAASTSCSAPATAWPPCPAPPHRGDRLMAYVAVKGGERGDRRRACLAGRGTPRRSGAAGTDARADRPAARPRGRPGDGGGRLLRPRPRGAGHQAGARRPDRGRLPAARLPHHPAALRRQRAARHRRACAIRAPHLRRPTRTCRAARCWARPSTTPTACWISPWPPRASRRRPRREAPAEARDRCRASPASWRRKG